MEGAVRVAPANGKHVIADAPNDWEIGHQDGLKMDSTKCMSLSDEYSVGAA